MAIVTVGSALKRNDDLDVWKDAARQLKKSAPIDIEEMDAKVYSRLEWTYNYLKSKKAKSLFLLCSLFPEDAKIPVEQLVLYGMGLRFFQDVDTIEDARVSAHAVVRTLVSSFLLLETADVRYVKMHDVVRDVAIAIGSKEEENKFMVKARIGLRDWPNNGITFENYSAISLMENDIYGLPDALEFPKLQTLLLQGNSNFKIPSNFFQGMKDLKVLDMSDNYKIRSLPPSITLLTALQTLCLENCRLLGDISIIGLLKQLEILSLSGSIIEEVPTHFTKLTHLRLFDLRNCYRLKQIAPGVISSLCKLEELYIGSSFTDWAVEGVEENSSGSASIAELKSSSRLTSLHVRVPNIDADMFPHDLNFQNLRRFEISIGTTEDPPESLEKTLGLTYHTRLSGPVEVLLKTTEGLLLHDCKGLKNIFKDLDSGHFGGLKKMKINGCYDMKYLLDPIDHGAPTAAFCNLEELWLRYLDNFIEICHGQLPSESFSQVRKLEVFYCHSMSNIVPSNLLSRIQYVEVVRAGFCSSLLNVFDLEGLASTEGGETGLLSRLQVLFLRDLRGLMRIWNGSNHFVKLCNLRSVTTWSCTKIRQLFPQSLVQGLVHLENLDVRGCEHLDEIFGTHEEEERVDRIVVVGETLGTSTRLQNLTTVDVCDCDRLRTIFPPSVAKGLVQLQKLYIECCAMMEAVIEDEKAEVATTEKIVFPRLDSITLNRLGSLACFCTSRYAVEYPSLEQVIILVCPKMETFGHGVQMTPKLKTVNLDIFGVDEGIWMGDLNATVQHIFNQKAKSP